MGGLREKSSHRGNAFTLSPRFWSAYYFLLNAGHLPVPHHYAQVGLSSPKVSGGVERLIASPVGIPHPYLILDVILCQLAVSRRYVTIASDSWCKHLRLYPPSRLAINYVAREAG